MKLVPSFLIVDSGEQAVSNVAGQIDVQLEGDHEQAS